MEEFWSWGLPRHPPWCALPASTAASTAPLARTLPARGTRAEPDGRGPRAQAQEYDYVFKLVLIGDSGVGKSCLLLRFAVHRRTPRQPTSRRAPHAVWPLLRLPLPPRAGSRRALVNPAPSW